MIEQINTTTVETDASTIAIEQLQSHRVNEWLEDESVESDLLFKARGITVGTRCIDAHYFFLKWCAGTDACPNVPREDWDQLNAPDFHREMNKRFGVMQSSAGDFYPGLELDHP